MEQNNCLHFIKKTPPQEKTVALSYYGSKKKSEKRIITEPRTNFKNPKSQNDSNKKVNML